MTSPTFGANLLDVARTSARQRSRIKSAELIEEVAAETAYQYLKTRANTGTNGQVINQSAMSEMRPYVHSIARNVLARQSGMVQSADRWAVSEFVSRRAAVEQAEGRILTSLEEDALADEIRSEQASRHRAQPGFHRRNHIPATLSRARLFRWIEANGAAGMEGRPVDASSTVDFAPDSLGDELLVRLDRKEITRTEARMYLWDAFAERHNAPKVARGSLVGVDVTRIANRVTSVGVVDVATRWLEHGASGAETKSLFAAFGPIHQAHKERVAGVLLGAPERFADRLYRASLSAAAQPVAA